MQPLSQPLQVDASTIQTFFEAWFDGIEEGFVELRPRANDKTDEFTAKLCNKKDVRTWFRHPTGTAKIADQINYLCSIHPELFYKTSWYFGTCPRNQYGEGGKEHVGVSTGVWADIDHHHKDPSDPDHAKETLRLKQAESTLQLLSDMGFMPTFVIQSGLGVGKHVYFRFTEVAEADIAGRLSFKLAKILDSDRQVAQVAAVMRIPGTYHTKTGQVVPVSILEHNEVTYEPDDLEDAFDTILERLGISLQEEIKSIYKSDFGWASVPLEHAKTLPNLCSRLQGYIDAPNAVDYKEWVHIASWARALRGEDPELFYSWSEGYTGYSQREADKKYFSLSRGPVSCVKFQNEFPKSCCLECPLFNMTKNPVMQLRKILGNGRIYGAPSWTEQLQKHSEHESVDKVIADHPEIVEKAKKYERAEFEAWIGGATVAAAAEVVDCINEDPETDQKDLEINDEDPITSALNRIKKEFQNVDSGEITIEEMVEESIEDFLEIKPTEHYKILRQEVKKRGMKLGEFEQRIKDAEACKPKKTLYSRYTLHKKSDGYYKEEFVGRDIVYDQITNFHIQADEILHMDMGYPDMYSLTLTIFIPERVISKSIQVTSDVFNDKKLFKANVTDSTMVFYGGDLDVTAFKQIILESKPKHIQGTRIIGWRNDSFVMEDRIIGKQKEELRVVPLDSNSQNHAVNWPEYDVGKWKEVAKAVINHFLYINRKNKMMLIAGWMMASFFAPYFRKLSPSREFPDLQLWGIPGSGKTTTAMTVMKLTKGNDHVLSVKGTKFPKLKGMAAQNALPVVFDEYKFNELTPQERDFFNQLRKKGYNEGAEQRGLPNQGVIDYILTAPVMVMGESRYSDEALLDRSLIIGMSRQDTTNEQFKEHFHTLNEYELERFGEGVLRFGIENRLFDGMNSIAVRYRYFENDLNELSWISNRKKVALCTASVGLSILESIAQMVGESFPTFTAEELALAVQEEECGENGQVISYLDKLMESTTSMLFAGEKYAFAYSASFDKLYVDRVTWYAALVRYYRDHGRSNELQDENTTRTALREEVSMPNSYLLSANEQKRIKNTRKQCFIVDLQNLEKKLGIDPNTFKNSEDE